MSRALRVAVHLACMLLVSGLGVVVAPQAHAVTYLCYGYNGCREEGYPNARYAAKNDRMYWRMYAGHNCTNYAAYRMVKSGMPNVRPWDGPGNAEHWGRYNAGRTDTAPRVGAVAWWKANTGLAGNVGHVAYVERVVSLREIVISQDSYGGTFSWARITKGSGDWPSGFIHFNDRRLRNTTRPSVSGEPKVDETLTASTGTWSVRPGTYAYQWRADGVDIAGATDSTLKVGLEQEGKRISVQVTAARLGYATTSAVSEATTAVAPAVLINTEEPVITGEPVVDSTLYATRGRWKPGRAEVEYQWFADGRRIEGATRRRLRARPALIGEKLAVRVKATKTGYRRAAADSRSTAPVEPGTFTPTSSPVVSGTAVPGEVLRLDPGSVTPTGEEPRIQWLRSGDRIAGANGETYEVTADDLGSRISARVTWEKNGYTTLKSRSAATSRVKATPVLRVRTEKVTPRRLRITVTVKTPDVRPVTGEVKVKALRTTVPLTLRRGAAATTLRKLPEGPLTIRVRYSGSDKVFTALETRTVRIRY